NRNFRIEQVEKAPSCPDWIFDVCFDPQTAGGLFFSLPAAKARTLVETMRRAGIPDAAIVGDVTGDHPGRILIE
ncbi:MAG: selenide, water dikinase SelD, partial [Smithellaceae bacterium]